MSENNNTALLIERVKRAIQSRTKFIIEKKNELGEKSFRRLLEKDLRLNKRQLDEPSVKETIGKLLLRVIESGTLEDEDGSDDSEEDEYSEDDEEEAKLLLKRKRKKSEKQPTRKTKTETETPNAKVSKLRKLCKDAGITKATHVFMKFKTNLEREEALERLLGKRYVGYSRDGARVGESQGGHRTGKRSGGYRRVEYYRRWETEEHEDASEL